jgi:hypothetical protein
MTKTMKSAKWINMLAAGLALLACTTACEDDADGNTPRRIDLTAPVLTEIAAPVAVATCDVVVDREDLDMGRTRIMAYGFCYSLSSNPTIHDATVTAMPLDGKLSATLTELADNTVYYVRAFATLYPDGVVYSPETGMTVGTVTIPPSE